MTHIILNSSIDSMQMSVLKGLFDSWNMKVEIADDSKTDKQEYEQLKNIFFNGSKRSMSQHINKYIE